MESTPDLAARSAAQPRATLSLFDAIAITVGIVIGAGIFRTPSTIANTVSSPAWLIAVWLLGGFVSLLGALTYAELATAYPGAGGDYDYLRRAYGERLGFLFAWARITVIQPGSIALLAFVFGDYATNLYALGPNSPALYAGIAVVALTGVGIIGIEGSRWTQNSLTIVEVSGLLLVIATGLFLVDKAPMAQAVPAQSGADGAGVSLQSLGFALVAVLFTFSGWNEAAYISAEVRDARRNMIRALVGSIAVLTVLYLLVNLALLRGLGFAGVQTSEAVAADLVARRFGATGAMLMSVVVAASALTSANATVLTGGRTSYALGQNFAGFRLFRPLGRWNGRVSSPINALLVQGAISFALVFAGAWQREGFEEMLGYTTPVFWFFLLLTGLSLIILRHRDPERPRPFRVPVYPLTPLLFCVTCGYMVWSGALYHRSRALVGILVLLAGVPVLFFAERAARRN